MHEFAARLACDLKTSMFGALVFLVVWALQINAGITWFFSNK